jgi:uncharacterized protein
MKPGNRITQTVTKCIVSFFIAIMIVGGCSSHEESFDFIDDQRGLLTQHEQQRIAEFHRALLRKLDIHIKIVVLRESPPDINREAARLFDTYALGKKTRGARGVLFLVDPAGKQVRAEIGYDLEPVFTDGFIGYIERKQMVPFFQANKVGPGMEATVELLVGKALGAIDESKYVVSEEIPRVGDHFSGGAGTRTTVGIASGAPEKKATSLAAEFGPRGSPEETLKQYIKALKLHIKDPNLGMYTPDTRRFFSTWVVTDAQQDNELQDLEKAIHTGVLLQNENLAVVRFPVANRQVPPYFFRQSDDGWMLDCASMSKTIRFNHLNQWFFKTRTHPFMFAFKDIVFDQNGFPHLKKGTIR